MVTSSYFEFLLNFCSPDDYFSELERLINEIDNVAGFHNEFKCIVHIDLTNGLTLKDDAKKLLFDTIEKLRNNKYFDGFKSFNMLCQDIVYDVFSNENVEELSLDANTISKFWKTVIT